MPNDSSLPLAALRPNQKAVIARVRADDPALLRHLESLGLVPGAEVGALQYSEFDQNLEIQVEGQKPKVVGLAISSQIYIEFR
jgi:DtxR family transcriptional regulator, Mn-dependent transcriptional regulator